MPAPDSFELQSDGSQSPIAIPHSELSSEALRGVVEAFVLREGTDYGTREFLLEQKVAHVIEQLDRRQAQILFDPISASVDIVTIKPGAAE
jgi:uncharacterized protein YheU (UPF0270 family)